MGNIFLCHLLPSPVQPLKVCSTYVYVNAYVYIVLSDPSLQRAIGVWLHCLSTDGYAAAPSVGPSEINVVTQSIRAFPESYVAWPSEGEGYEHPLFFSAQPICGPAI